MTSRILQGFEDFASPSSDNGDLDADLDAFDLPDADLPSLEVKGQTFYVPSVAVKVQQRHDRLAEGRLGDAEDWDGDFEDLGDDTDAETGDLESEEQELVKLRIPEELAKRQKQVRRDAENMRNFAHHVEDLRFLHERARTLSNAAGATRTNALQQSYQHDLDRARVLLEFADISEDDAQVAQRFGESVSDGDAEILTELLGVQQKDLWSSAAEPGVVKVGVVPATISSQSKEPKDEDEEEDWDAEFASDDEAAPDPSPLTAVNDTASGLESAMGKLHLAPSQETIAKPAASHTTSFATLGGPIPEAGHRIKFEVGMIPVLTGRIEELKKRLAEYTAAVAALAGSEAGGRLQLPPLASAVRSR